MTAVIRLDGRAAGASERAAGSRSRRGRLLYEEVIDLIERLVVDQGLGPGDMLPSQNELSQLAGVSLITVRRALEELEREGRVRRRQGLGTFLSRPKILADPSRAGGLGGTLDEAQATVVTTELLGIALGEPSADVRAALDLDVGQLVWSVRRLRRIDGKPSILETALIPEHLAPDLPNAYQDGSLYETLRATYGLEDDYEEQFLDVIHAGGDVRALLKLAQHAFVVRIQGVSRDHNGVPFDCFQQVYPATEFAFAIAGQAERRLHQGRVGRDWSVTAVTGPRAGGDEGGAGPRGSGSAARSGSGRRARGSA